MSRTVVRTEVAENWGLFLESLEAFRAYFRRHNKLLMTGPKGNSEFCFPETLNVPRGEAEGNIEG